MRNKHMGHPYPSKDNYFEHKHQRDRMCLFTNMIKCIFKEQQTPNRIGQLCLDILNSLCVLHILIFSVWKIVVLLQKNSKFI